MFGPGSTETDLYFVATILFLSFSKGSFLRLRRL
jgi:hypothetical protein